MNNTWRSRIEKVIEELKEKTCINFYPLAREAESSHIRFLSPEGKNSAASIYDGGSILNATIASADSLPHDLVNTLCIFFMGAALDAEELVKYNKSEVRIDCLSRNSSEPDTELGYISMLDAEKINALYNCGGINQFIQVKLVTQVSSFAN